MNRKPVFVHIPKTAGNSVRAALNGVLDLIDIGHSTPRRQGLMGEEYFRFCFVRNPYARLRSAFYHLIDIHHNLGNETDKFQAKRKLLRDTYGDNFRRFVLDRGFEKIKVAHFFPQTTWTHPKGNCDMHFIGRVEHLDAEWKRLAAALNVDLPPLGRRNTTRYASNKESDYTEDMKAIVREFYKTDFDLLGYSSDSELITKPESVDTLFSAYKSGEMHEKEMKRMVKGQLRTTETDWSRVAPYIRFRYERARERLPIQASTVYEIGCGIGVGLNYLASLRPDLKFIGLDNNADAIRFGTHSFGKTPNMTLMHTPTLEVVEHIITPGAFLIALEVIEHFNDQELDYFKRHILAKIDEAIFSFPYDQKNIQGTAHFQSFDIYKIFEMFPGFETIFIRRGSIKFIGYWRRANRQYVSEHLGNAFIGNIFNYMPRLK